MKTLLGVLLAVALVAYAAFLATRNDGPINVDLLFTGIEQISLWKGLLSAFVLGAGTVGLACIASIVRLRLGLRRQGRAIARLEQEIHGLRTLPLEDAPAANASTSRG